MTAESLMRVRALPVIAAGAAVLLWSSAFAGLAYGLQAFSPAELSLLRFAVASLCLLPAVAVGAIRLPPRRDWPAVALLALIGMSVYQLALGYSLTRIPAGSAAVIIALAPGVTTALAALRLGEAITPRMGLGLGVAFIGVVLVTIGSGRAVRFEPMALFALLAVLVTSIYFVWQKPLLARSNALGFTTASIFAATLGLLPFGLNLPAKLAVAPIGPIACGIYLGIVPTVFGYVLWNWALSRAPAAKVSSFLYLQPLLAGLIAWAWLGQTPGPLVMVGAAFALGGVVLTLRGSAGNKAAPVRVPEMLPEAAGPIGKHIEGSCSIQRAA